MISMIAIAEPSVDFGRSTVNIVLACLFVSRLMAVEPFCRVTREDIAVSAKGGKLLVTF